MAEQIQVLHVGPDVKGGGGMATVIDLLSRFSSTEVDFTSASTWHPASRTRGLLPTARLLAGLLRRGRRPAWVHVHLSEGGSFIREGAVVVVARALGIGTAATLHGADFLHFAERHPRLVRRVLGACRVVFPLGPRAAARIAELAPSARVYPVLNPVDLTELQNAPASFRKSTVLFGGEVGHRKGVDRLLAAWPEVRRRHAGATCLLVGPPADELGELPEGITQLGPVPRCELLGLLKTTDVACLPSRDEALPMFVLESLGLGVPVVTTPVGEIGQLGEAQGVALTDGAPADLADRLLFLLEDPARRREWGARGAAWVAENCTVDAVGSALTSGYLDRSGLLAGARADVDAAVPA